MYTNKFKKIYSLNLQPIIFRLIFSEGDSNFSAIEFL
jgi:hypothetical protein